MSLVDDLRADITRDGPMPFDEFMARALYDPAGGFFTTGRLRSTKDGDFLTSPEVSPAFGRTLARFVASERNRLGGVRFELAELGAGSGSLLGPLLEVLDPPPDAVYAVEASPAARRELERAAGVAVLDHVAELPGRFRGVVIANELLDNLPSRIAVRAGDRWEERYVALEGGELVLVSAPARPATAGWARAHSGSVADGAIVEVQIAATDLVSDVVGRLDAGALVAIDYGGTTEELLPRRSEGTLRTYRGHHLGPDPLHDPGATDITVDVDFTAMAAAAEAAGAVVELHRQDDFLESLGLRGAIGRLRAQEVELAREPSRAMERLSLRSQRTDAEALLHPRGLGDFRVLIARVVGTDEGGPFVNSVSRSNK